MEPPNMGMLLPQQSLATPEAISILEAAKALRDKEIRESVQQIVLGVMASVSHQTLLKEMDSKLSSYKEQLEKSKRDEEELLRTLNQMIKEQCDSFHWSA
ncbi:MAG: hypothetical protein LLG04_18695 [Parachlamydia sp.]|nr:hypothetical protein [Parachlamydia sp.]